MTHNITNILNYRVCGGGVNIGATDEVPAQGVGTAQQVTHQVPSNVSIKPESFPHAHCRK